MPLVVGAASRETHRASHATLACSQEQTTPRKLRSNSNRTALIRSILDLYCRQYRSSRDLAPGHSVCRS